MVDWKEMFKKYMEIVIRNEGVDFLYSYEWTEEEWAEIQKIGGGQ